MLRCCDSICRMTQPTGLRVLTIVGFLLSVVLPAQAAVIWVEGEKPDRASVTRHRWWYDQVKREHFSGGDFISNFNDDRPGEVEYRFAAPAAGEYQFWVHANPVKAKLSYSLNGGQWTPVDLEKNQDSVNVAADGKPDLRFLAWMNVGKVSLRAGENTIAFRMHSELHNHGYIDCFALANEDFTPQGKLRPAELAAAARTAAEENKGWFAFAPGPDRFESRGGVDLRWLNEKVAGEGGFIAARGHQFVHSATGRPVRFWAVNGPPHSLKDRDSLRRCARWLARYGVNMVRLHGGVFDAAGEVDPAKIRHILDVVQAMKAEGIYSHLSIYFPLWLKPKPGLKWLDGYDGQKHPFAALYFNKDFQEQYRSWWRALLLTPDESGRRLVDEPAVAGVEIINEDSYFFWTFNTDNIPDAQLRIIETQFADWLKNRYGSLDAAMEKWGRVRHKRDNTAEGRISFRYPWNIINERKQRDRDTVRFLLESQCRFYQQTIEFLRGLGLKSLITCSNWTTASPELLGPLERYSYTLGDFIDRHGYFGCNHKGENAAWSIRDGHTYSDRSALRFDAEQPGKPRSFVHPVMDIEYNGKPSMISETTWCRPNRYRSEGPLMLAAYGALQDTDAIVHFALDGADWAVKPNFFMQPWTLMSPAMMGQFPAAALIYRLGLVSPGDVLAEINLRLEDLLDLKGTPMPQNAAFDELRLKDVPQGTEIKPGNVIDPLVHLAGRTKTNITAEGGAHKLADLSRYIDRRAQTVVSTTGQLRLDYGRGVLTINAPAAQGISGHLRQAGTADLADVVISSDMELGHIVAVSLDGRPLAGSERILLQVMSEEKNSGFRTQPAGDVQRIVSIGRDPWLVRQISGTVKFKRADAAGLKVTALDHAGHPAGPAGTAAEIALQPATLYYLLTR